MCSFLLRACDRQDANTRAAPTCLLGSACAARVQTHKSTSSCVHVQSTILRSRYRSIAVDASVAVRSRRASGVRSSERSDERSVGRSVGSVVGRFAARAGRLCREECARVLRGNDRARGALRARRRSAARTNRAFGLFRAHSSGAPGLSAPSCMLLSMLVSKKRLLQVDVSKELALFHQLADSPAHASAAVSLFHRYWGFGNQGTWARNDQVWYHTSMIPLLGFPHKVRY